MDLQTIITNILYVMTIILLGGLLVLVKAKLGDETFNKLVEIVDTQVFAKEQTIKGEGKGAEKKKEVVEAIIEADPKGLPDDLAELDDLIESRVYLMNQNQKGAK